MGNSHESKRELGLDYEPGTCNGMPAYEGPLSAAQRPAPAAPVQEPVAWMNKHGACKTSLFREVEAGAKEEYTVPLYTAPPAAPVQEPVGFYDAENNDLRVEIPLGEGGDWWEPVYTTPPAAQRKPLTDEQILEHFRETIDTGSLLSFADGVRFAESAHGIKEKNGGAT